MSTRFEELDFRRTAIGDIALRRRTDPATGVDIYEVKLDDEWLMSSMFTAAEEALARIGLARLQGFGFDVVVGGLGLGYTAVTALEDSRVRELIVVELLDPVIDWHERGLVPLGEVLTADSRCRLDQGDFFAMARGDGFDHEQPGRLFDAVLLDIDHSPVHVLDDGSASFYGIEGMRSLATHLKQGGVYAMWSNDPPDPAYLDVLAQVFTSVEAQVVTFPNPLQGRDATATIYSGIRGGR
ncbi:MAG: spermidine synthase [Demequinaceae bacterium]|nr:spermidine synthase [Demequinaceae bacterium]